MRWYKQANQEVGKPFNFEAENAAAHNGLESTEERISLPVDFVGKNLVRVPTPVSHNVVVYYTKVYEPSESGSREHPESSSYTDASITNIVLGKTDVTELVDPNTMVELQKRIQDIADSEFESEKEAREIDRFESRMENRSF